MLNAPRLDDLNYTTLFERARAMIPSLTDEWTDLNYHDPGITTLQVFAWLYDTLGYYMNATGEVHRLKYLKLLGIVPREQVARCLVAVEDITEPLSLPAGSPIYAEDTRFESEHTVEFTPNRMTKLYNFVGEAIYDLTAFVSADNDFAEIFTLGDTQAMIYMGFESSFNQHFSFYTIVKDTGRNPFDTGFTLSRAVWEYYSDGAWIEADAVEDETCGFLRNGFVKLTISGQPSMLQNNIFEKGYYLRCRVIENEYDVLPSIGRVEVNSFWASQYKSESICLELTANGSDRLLVDHYIPNDYLITVGVDMSDTASHDKPIYTCLYMHGEDETDQCSVETAEHNRIMIVFDKGYVPPNGSRVMVCAMAEELLSESVLSYTDGTAGQNLSFIRHDVAEIGVALVGNDAEGRYTFELWEQCDDITCAGYADRCFSYDKADGIIRFGDSIHGMVPEIGLGVMVLKLKTSLFDRGNILAGKLNRVDCVPALEVNNPEPALGGIARETAQELQDRIEQRLSRVTRAVTVEDYRTIVQDTPGLLIDGVSVITMEEYSRFYNVTYRPNTVIVAVKPMGYDHCPQLSNSYRRLIQEHLLKYRLLTTDIEVISCKYVGIYVYGRISLYDNNEASRQLVLNCIKEMIDHVSTVDFGVAVDFGRLFSVLEMVESVRAIAELSLEYTGMGALKNEQGDIVIFKDSLSYLKEIGIEFS